MLARRAGAPSTGAGAGIRLGDGRCRTSSCRLGEPGGGGGLIRGWAPVGGGGAPGGGGPGSEGGALAAAGSGALGPGGTPGAAAGLGPPLAASWPCLLGLAPALGAGLGPCGAPAACVRTGAGSGGSNPSVSTMMWSQGLPERPWVTRCRDAGKDGVEACGKGRQVAC